MMQYRPSIVQDFGIYEGLELLPGELPPQKKLNFVLESLYGEIVAKARKHHLPMVDLPNSFDIYDNGLYVNQIEPSNRGGDIIAKVIGRTIGVKEHGFFYMRKDGEVEKYQLKEPNSQWKVFID